MEKWAAETSRLDSTRSNGARRAKTKESKKKSKKTRTRKSAGRQRRRPFTTSGQSLRASARAIFGHVLADVCEEPGQTSVSRGGNLVRTRRRRTRSELRVRTHRSHCSTGAECVQLRRRLQHQVQVQRKNAGEENAQPREKHVVPTESIGGGLFADRLLRRQSASSGGWKEGARRRTSGGEDDRMAGNRTGQSKETAQAEPVNRKRQRRSNKAEAPGSKCRQSSLNNGGDKLNN